MYRKKRLVQKEFEFPERYFLVFRTIPSEKTLKVSVNLPFDTNWRINCLGEGI